MLVDADGHDARVVLPLDRARVILTVGDGWGPPHQLAAPGLVHDGGIELVHLNTQRVDGGLNAALEARERITVLPQVQLPPTACASTRLPCPATRADEDADLCHMIAEEGKAFLG